MATTYTPIATTTLGSNTASPVTFTSIPQTYTDLILVINAGRVAGGADNDGAFRVGNGSVDTGTNYSRTILYGNGTSAGSVRGSNLSYGSLDYYGGFTSSIDSNQIIHFMNYSNTTTYKTILVRSNWAANGTDAITNLWRSTSAINIISLYLNSALNGTWLAGSTFTLYGIKAA